MFVLRVGTPASAYQYVYSTWRAPALVAEEWKSKLAAAVGRVRGGATRHGEARLATTRSREGLLPWTRSR